MNRLSRTFPAQLGAFEQVKVLIDEFGAAAALAPEDRHKLTLIVEELFINTVNHGHHGGSDSPVRVTFEETGNGVRLTYEDSAPQYDPFAVSGRTDIDSTINERRVGGLGVFLTLGLTDHADYNFVDGRNCISLIFAPTRD